MRNYYEGASAIRGDVYLRTRYFTQNSREGLAAGGDLSVMFTLNRASKDVWPYFKDFNLWQNAHGHYYSGVIGDLEGKTFALGLTPGDLGPHRYHVLKVIPEYLIVINQPAPKPGTRDAHLPGLGSIDPGFHVFTLNEHAGRTVVTGLMEHASLMDSTEKPSGMTEEDALGPWRDVRMVPDWLRKWRDDFIPTLTNVVYERS